MPDTVAPQSVNLEYDSSDIDSIVAYGKRLEGSTLRAQTSLDELQSPTKRRGSWGNALEEYFFKYKPNSSSEADFEEAGLELKSTPMKRNARGELVAKERLVLTMIDYMTVVDETFETSHLVDKAEDILLVAYEYDSSKDPLDYEVLFVERWAFPKEDIPQIKRDWEVVVEKVRAGKAHEISGSDTMYLEACTKAANASVRRYQPFSAEPAKPRAWALKAAYMTGVENELLTKSRAIARGKGEETLDLLTLVRKRFEPFFGLTEDELANLFGLTKSKDLCARITRRILGVKDDEKIAEFEKAGIKPKTIRLRSNGRPKEAVSFPTFDYFELEQQPFEESDFYGYLQQKYLFVIYREADGRPDEYRLADVCFWQMPDADLEEAERCYLQMQENVRRGRADVSVKSSENRCCHVRPHGRDSRDTKPQPHGEPVVKKCFWLNQSYLAEEIAKALDA